MFKPYKHTTLIGNTSPKKKLKAILVIFLVAGSQVLPMRIFCFKNPSFPLDAHIQQ